MTIKETIKKGMIKLKTENITEPNLKARLVLQYVLNKPRNYLIIYDDKVLTLRQEVNYFKAIKRLTEGEPIQYITHNQEFMKMNFYVNNNVLIPRADTEILVQEVIKISKKNNFKNILDLCTGSGAIAISLAKYLDDVNICATDISEKALDVAKLNAKNNKVNSKINFIKSDLFKKVPKEQFDIIVSNPPYVKKGDIPKLSKEVQNEPKIALDGGISGLDFYKRIIPQSKNFLKKRGYLCFEIGYNQKEDVFKIIKNDKNFVNTYCLQDLYGMNRVIVTMLE